MAGRIKLLFLAATPSETSRVRVGAEARLIKEALSRCPVPHLFEFHENHAVLIDQLQGIVVDAAAQIVHFAGHGSKHGELVFEDRDGKPRPANPAAIARLFELAGQGTRLVVLNACYSHEQAMAIADHVDVVIGMTAAVPDDTAIAFSSELYGHLAQGKSIGMAFELAKNNASLQNLPGDHMPQIEHRAGVDPGEVFLTGPEAAAVPPPWRAVLDESTDVIEKIRALVAADRLGEALDLLHGEEADLPAERQDELTLLDRQWSSIERDEGRAADPSALGASRQALARAILRDPPRSGRTSSGPGAAARARSAGAPGPGPATSGTRGVASRT